MGASQMLSSGAGEPVADCVVDSMVCSHCGLDLPLSMFYAYRNAYLSRCKKCHGLAQKTCRMCAGVFEGKSNQSFCSTACRRASRPQTFKFCAHCKKLFGPVSHLSTRYCSTACKCDGQRKDQPKPRQRPTHQARAAQSAIARAIKDGKIRRPDVCSECEKAGRIEAAHHDYGAPFDVRWLCRSCHAKWDWSQPKGGTLGTLWRRNSSNPITTSAVNAAI